MLHKFNHKHRIITFLISFILIAGQAGFLPLNGVYGAEKSDEETYTVFVGTDRHGSTENLVNVVNAAEEYVESNYSVSISKTIHAGDLVDSNDVSSTLSSDSGLAAVNAEFRSVLGWLAEDGSDNYYTYGDSHDKSVSSENVANHFLDSASMSGSNQPTRDAGVEELGDEIYLWGIDHYEMSTKDKASDAVAAFTSWVNRLPEDDHHVIIIASHVPMHDRRNSSTGGDNKGGQIWANAINEAAQNEDILFFWGHNHTGWGGNDLTHQFVTPGGSIIPQDGNSSAANSINIDFTYGIAGYIGKTGNWWNGSTVTVTSHQIIVDHYTTSGHSDTAVLDRKDPVHNWNDWTVIGEADCTEDGAREKSCVECGEIVTEVIPATGHEWNGEYTIDTPATCSTEGSKSIHCAVCGAVDENTVTVIPAEHSFGEWIEINDEGCGNAGIRQRKCDVCGFVETENLEPTDHEWEDDYTIDIAASCTSDGSKSIHCRNCDAVRDSTVIPATGHDWTEPEYEWTDDNASVTAIRTCAHDSSHQETETVETTSEVTRAATYTAMGQTTYTAVFANEAFSNQTKTVNNIAKLTKKTNPITVKANARTIKYKVLKKKKQTIAASKAFTVRNAKGKVTYKKLSGNKKITLSSAGMVTVKKKLKKGTYKVKVKVTAAGTTDYNVGSKMVTLSIKVK